MINERAIINILILGATLLLAPFVISSTLNYDNGPVMVLSAFTGLALAFFVLRDRLSMWPLIGLSILGTLNFLKPVPLKATHILLIMLFLYYVTGYVFIRQASFKLGKMCLLLPIMIVCGIVFYHNPTIGVRIFGSSTEGGRPAILIYLGVIGYFCGINLKSPSVKFVRRIPLYCVIATVISAIPYFLTTVIPSLAPYVAQITDNVNVGAYWQEQIPSLSDSADQGIGRFAVFGAIGGCLQIYLVSRYPMASWLRPDRWWVAGLSLLCLVSTAFSGYRSTLTAYLGTVFIATWCYYGLRSLFLPLFIAVVMGALVIVSSDHLVDLPLNKLPLVAQRTLSFMPGDWDQEAIESAKSSNDFRQNIINVYMKEYFWKSPFFGNGFDIDAAEYNRLNDTMFDRFERDPDYLQAQIFITGKLFHTGWLSVYDCVGFVGSAAFIWLGLAEMWLSLRLIFGRHAKRKSPLFVFYVWLAATIVTSMITFFTVFGDFPATFVSFCIFGIVLSQIYDMEDSGKVEPPVPATAKPAPYPVMKGALAHSSRRIAS